MGLVFLNSLDLLAQKGVLFVGDFYFLGTVRHWEFFCYFLFGLHVEDAVLEAD